MNKLTIEQLTQDFQYLEDNINISKIFLDWYKEGKMSFEWLGSQRDGFDPYIKFTKLANEKFYLKITKEQYYSLKRFLEENI